ncbi:oligosaccharide flippase family protein [Vibrio fluvialis]|nr:oligosaccharide flippase family protein [Vibrio fluvialis]
MLTKILNFIVGSVGAQIIALMVIPFITRLYAPVEYGFFSMYLSISVIVSSISLLKLDQAIFKAKDKEDRSKLTGLIVISLITISLLTVITSLISYYYNGNATLLWITIGVISLSLFEFCIAIGINLNLVNKIRNFRLIQAVTIGLSQILLFSFLSDHRGLIIGHVLGYAVFIIFMLKSCKNDLSISFGLKGLKESFIKNKNFIKYQTPASLLNSISQNLIIVIIAWGYGEELAGLYGLTYKVLTLPNSIIGNSVRQIFYKTAEDIKYNYNLLYKKYLSVSSSLALVSIMGFGSGFFIYDHLFSAVFGEAWAYSATIAKILTPWFMIMLINPPSIALFNVLDRQKEYLKFEVVNCVTRISILVLAPILQLDFTYLLGMYVVQAFLMNMTIVFLSRRFLLKLCKNDCINMTC